MRNVLVACWCVFVIEAVAAAAGDPVDMAWKVVLPDSVKFDKNGMRILPGKSPIAAMLRAPAEAQFKVTLATRGAKDGFAVALYMPDGESPRHDPAPHVLAIMFVKNGKAQMACGSTDEAFATLRQGEPLQRPEATQQVHFNDGGENYFDIVRYNGEIRFSVNYGEPAIGYTFAWPESGFYMPAEKPAYLLLLTGAQAVTYVIGVTPLVPHVPDDPKLALPSAEPRACLPD